MRVVVSDHASDVNLRLQCALSMFGAVFVDMARIHAAVVAVKGHRFLGLVVLVVVGDLDVRHGSIRCGSPVRFSHCNRCNNRRDNTDGFQMLFEINSIFFIFTVFWGHLLLSFACFMAAISHAAAAAARGQAMRLIIDPRIVCEQATPYQRARWCLYWFVGRHYVYTCTV
jgi:signal transduction histidine kinase